MDTKVVPNDVTLLALSESVVGVSQGQLLFSKKRVEVGPVIQKYVVVVAVVVVDCKSSIFTFWTSK